MSCSLEKSWHATRWKDFRSQIGGTGHDIYMNGFGAATCEDGGMVDLHEVQASKDDDTSAW